MSATIQHTYSEAPFAPAYMAQAFRPSPGWRSERGCPDTQLDWRGYRVEPSALEALRNACGLNGSESRRYVDLLYPQVTGFRLIMAALTHHAWPLPIWNALQIRNRVVLHRPLEVGAPLDLAVQPSGWRVLAKGLEIDLHARLGMRGLTHWESIVTFYYRGRYGEEACSGDLRGADAAAPVVASPDAGNKDTGRNEGPAVAQWNVGDGNRWAFGKLTGDYNGLHQWDLYARRMGFPAAFPHPQRVLGQCLARLPQPAPGPLRLDLWIKGPVFFGRDVTMRHQSASAAPAREFGLWIDGDPRPALIGSLASLT